MYKLTENQLEKLKVLEFVVSDAVRSFSVFEQSHTSLESILEPINDCGKEFISSLPFSFIYEEEAPDEDLFLCGIGVEPSNRLEDSLFLLVRYLMTWTAGESNPSFRIHEFECLAIWMEMVFEEIYADNAMNVSERTARYRGPAPERNEGPPM